MVEEKVNIAEAKKHFSELLGQVAYGKKQILITKRGKPMARLIPAGESDKHLGNARGWLDEDDSFYGRIDKIIKERSAHLPRILTESDGD